MSLPDLRLPVSECPFFIRVRAITHVFLFPATRLSALSGSTQTLWAHVWLRRADSTLPQWLLHLQNAPGCQYLASKEETQHLASAIQQEPPHGASAVQPMEACHLSTPWVSGQWQSSGCAVLSRLGDNMQTQRMKPTFVVVVFHGEDTAPRGTSVVHDGFDVQWFDCEWIDDPDQDPLCTGKQISQIWLKNAENNDRNAVSSLMRVSPGACVENSNMKVKSSAKLLALSALICKLA